MVSPTQNFQATITANGQTYSAWETVMVKREFSNPISVFEFTPVEGSYGTSAGSLRLKPGDNVEVKLAGQTALTGIVTTRSVSYDGKTHEIIIAGKSFTGPLIDSHVVVKPGNMNGSTFEQAAKSVMAPHNINLIMKDVGDAATKTFDYLSVQYGEFCSEFISRIALQRGLFLSDDAQGNLVASKTNTSSAAATGTFVEGQNILSCTCVMDNQGVAGKNSGVGSAPATDSTYPSRAYSATATGSGPANITRSFIAEHPVTSSADLQDRVQHEADINNLPIFTATVTVAGWTNPNGQLWAVMDSVSLCSPMLFWADTTTVQLTINTVVFHQDMNGSTTTIEMKLPLRVGQAASSGAGPAPAGPSLFPSNASTTVPDQPDYTVQT